MWLFKRLESEILKKLIQIQPKYPDLNTTKISGSEFNQNTRIWIRPNHLDPDACLIGGLPGEEEDGEEDIHPWEISIIFA